MSVEDLDVFNSAPDMIFSINPQGEIEAINPAFERMLENKREDWIGKKFHSLVTLEDQTRTLSAISRIFAGENITLETCLLSSSQNKVFVELACTSISRQEKVTSALIFARNISEKRKLEATIKETMKELAHFASLASHDLKAPLRVISSFAQLLSGKYKGKIDEEADRWITFIVDGTKRMTSLIDALTKYTRVAWQVSSFAETSIADLVKGVLLGLKTAIQEAHAEVITGELPVIETDRTKVGIIFHNLIENAIKFRGEQPLRIQIASKQERDRWIFSVKDNGIGIEEKYLDKVFEVFSRIHKQEEYPGSGIGLATCKRIVQSLDGEIWVESSSSAGSTFFFSLPVLAKEAF
jgi:PAS domain S-box-containing protein